MRKSLAIAIAVALAFLGTVLVPTPAHAKFRCADPEAADGLGSREHRDLQYDLWIPEHEAKCAAAVGLISFAQKNEPDAIADFVNRRTLWLGLNQPLATTDWRTAMTSNSFSSYTYVYHMPMLMQGFVVTTNISTCTTPKGGVRFTPLTLSLVYSGVIRTWGDPLLEREQATRELAGCTERISIGVRDGNAWSNHVLKDYMSKQNPVFEGYEKRELLSTWPGVLDITCRGFSDPGMAACGNNVGSIAYMPYTAAKAANLTLARLANKSGKFEPPVTDPSHTWPSNCEKAVPGAVSLDRPEFLPPFSVDWSTVSLTYPSQGYALCAFHYAVAVQSPQGNYSPYSAKNMEDHLEVMISKPVQQKLTQYGYAPLPEALRDQIMRDPIADIHA